MAVSGFDAQRDRLLEGLHGHALAYSELGRQFGAALGLHVTEANALIEILGAQDRGLALTQSALAQRVGLTAGATSSLISRLEAAGHIRRVRDTTDRRVVTVHANASVDARLHEFFDPLVERLSAVLSRYPPDLLAECDRLLTEVGATMNDYSREQR
ncbi:MarR family transcriptional regulator [Paractinoplanes maris]|uniref:MarR family transcriptional regulator n=1 Tax=Paractinoplanes maris TaxID=1734446 RepID=UPI002021A04E|nr:helix-turn-helix domain-containing protein [Actinoplanes maris]